MKCNVETTKVGSVMELWIDYSALNCLEAPSHKAYFIYEALHCPIIESTLELSRPYFTRLSKLTLTLTVHHFSPVWWILWYEASGGTRPRMFLQKLPTISARTANKCAVIGAGSWRWENSVIMRQSNKVSLNLQVSCCIMAMSCVCYAICRKAFARMDLEPGSGTDSISSQQTRTTTISYAFSNGWYRASLALRSPTTFHSNFWGV